MHTPLVSIIVITYNSAKYVLETLESAKNQTYQNIELIISDDCSQDNTIDICRKWLTENKYRFVNSRLITVEQNTGIPANCNRGVKASNGEWIKLIAGDDYLSPDSIKIFVEYCEDRKDIKIVAGKMLSVNNNKEILLINPIDKDLIFFSYDAKKQYKRLLKRSFNFAPAAFIKRQLIEDVGFFDENYKYFEDLPMWLKICGGGIKIHYLDQAVVNYRIGENSMINNRKTFYNLSFMSSYYDFKRKYIFKIIPYYDIVFYQSQLIEFINYKVMVNIFDNKRTPIASKFKYFIFLFSFNRYWYFIKDFFSKASNLLKTTKS